MAAASAPVKPARFSSMLAGELCARHVAQMTTDDKDRDERLAAALRENLRRRKAQARAQEQAQRKQETGDL